MIVDWFSRWPKAISIPDISSTTVAQAFLGQWVSRFGMPAEIIPDRGAQSISQLWSDVALLLGTSLHQATAYHPQANGLLERFHRQLKASLSAHLSGHNWMDQLPWVMLRIRAAHKDDLGASPVEMVYRTPLVLP